MNKNQPAHKPVLSDHERRGKKLVPPLVAAFGPFSYVEWINSVLPEVIWIGLLHHSVGEADGNDIAVALAQGADKYATLKPIPLFVGASHYRLLSEDAQLKVASELERTGKLAALQRALLPLVQLYPTCPFKFLFKELPSDEKEAGLASLKLILCDLFDKRHRRSVMVQGTVVYIGFVLGRLKVRRGLALSHFLEIEKYPTTELSQRVASAAFLAALNFFAEITKTSSWPVEFWNQGQQIEPCTFGKDKSHE